MSSARHRWRWLAALLAVGMLVGIGGRSAVARARPSAVREGSDGFAAQTGLHVIPFPGTPDASPSSQVIFSSLSRSELRSVEVTGSRSGPHSGRLEALPDGAGTEFVPAQPFAPGERVAVTAWLSSPAAGTASGHAGATHLRFGFGVGVASAAASTAAIDAPAAQASASYPTKSYHSQPGLHPPVVNVTSDPDTSSGSIFLTVAHSPQVGPMILNAEGQLVWFHRVNGKASGVQSANLEVQSYHGQRVLTWSQEDPTGRKNHGEDVIMNSSYKRIALLRPADGNVNDGHEFQISPQGTAWMMTWRNVKANLTSVGGPANGRIHDYVIQELDIHTGKLLWQWDAYGHIPLSASHRSPSKGNFDAFHLNSIQQLSDGALLVSSRSTWSVYKIDVKTGHIMWTLGGKYSNFKMGPGTNFEWQHDAHRLGNSLTLFDDADSPQEEPQSSAKKLAVNFHKRTVTLVRSYTHRPALLSPVEGSAEVLPNQNVFVGWGSEPEFTEFSPTGKQIFNGSFALGESSYRVYRFHWYAKPLTRPALAASRGSHGGCQVWASWNGATSVASWRVLGGSSAGSLKTLTTRPRSSFETQISLNSQPKYLEVQALGGHGHVIGTSAVKSPG